MCGIIGIHYGPKGPEGEDWSPTELASLMFPAIVHRGPHAWGYMWCPGDASEIGFSRTVGRADTKAAIESIEIPDDSLWWAGHVRYATHGAPEHLPNNHPLPHGDIVGMHNGVLRDWRRIIELTGREDESSQVDSEAIFAAVNKWGMRKGLSKIDGDMVTVFANRTDPKVLRIARTFNRPLVYATTAAGSLIFASEDCAIDATACEHGPVTDFKGRHRMLTVKRGAITERVQFRTTRDPVEHVALQHSSGRLTYPQGVSGITDHFHNQAATSLADPVREQRATPRVLAGLTDPSRDTRSQVRPGTTPPSRDIMLKKPDMFGGVYLGANTWRLPNGELMNAEEYIKWGSDRYQTILRVQTYRTRDDH